MKRRIAALTLCVLFAASLGGCAASGQGVSDSGCTAYAPVPASADMTEKTEEFALRSAGELMDGGENFCYSPISLYLALAMASSGAEGETLAQFNDALGAANRDTLSADCAKLYDTLSCDDELTKLYVANSVWARGGVAPKAEYERRLKEQYRAEWFNVDFSDPQTDRAMTDWVADKTQGLLKPEFQHDESTVEVLLNTLYFKAQWDDPFREALTEPADFTAAGGTSVSVPFMHAHDIGRGADADGYLRASRSFAGGGEMTFVLPDEGTTLPALLKEHGLPALLGADGDGMREIEWSMPRFDVDTTMNLIPMLKRLGITDAFDAGKADFSAASDTPAVIGAVRQGTHLAVDETGVEAAAYTEIAKDEGAAIADGETLTMNLNRPFLYAVRDKSGTLLFVGTCATMEPWVAESGT